MEARAPRYSPAIAADDSRPFSSRQNQLTGSVTAIVGGPITPMIEWTHIGDHQHLIWEIEEEGERKRDGNPVAGVEMIVEPESV